MGKLWNYRSKLFRLRDRKRKEGEEEGETEEKGKREGQAAEI